MQAARALLFVFLAAGPAAADNPLAKVFQMIDELTVKIVKDGEAEAKAYKEFFEWCDDAAANLANEIKTAKGQKEKLEAKIGECSSNIDTATSKIEELVGAIAASESELKDATVIRGKESEDFVTAEKELADSVNTLDRAITTLSREMQKSGAAFAQVDTTSMTALLQSLSVVIDAAAFSNNDKTKLVALVQQNADAEDGELGAPAAAVYESKSGSIVELLEDMKEKADGQLADLRKAETAAAHNYSMLKQSLKAQAAADTKDMEEEKASKAANEEGKATATGDLEGTVKDLKTASDALALAQANCMTTASDHQTTVASRDEELKVIAEAKKILTDTTSGAASQTYSLLQLQSRADQKNSEVVTLVGHLAKKYRSAALAQLTSRIKAVVRFGTANGGDVFAKVKELVQNMIVKLEKEAEADATEKAYCDEEMSKTEAKKEELEDDVSKLSTKIDQAASNSVRLKEEAKQAQADLATLAKQQAEMDKIRQEQHADYVVAKADLELGLGGIRKALGLLREYYSNKDGEASMLQNDVQFSAMMQQPAMPEKHEASGGAGGSIIGILEVCESDFAANLAKEESEEADSQSEYDQMTQENKITRSTKEQDVKYKTQEFKGEDKSISELSGDQETANTELSAVLEYYGKIKERCVAKPETYEEKKARRTAEIDGLKQALSILENEAAFLQRKHGVRSFRGALEA